MASRHFPVRPNLDQLKHQAKDLLRALRRGDAEALEELREFRAGPVDSAPVDPASARLADAQFVLARSYGIPSWARLVVACQMTDAIWRGDVEAVRELVARDPRLLTEDARGVKGNWGPPMSYAATLGQDAVIAMLRDLGASDLQYAFGRACLTGKVETARRLHAMMGGPRPEDALWRPAYTLSVASTELLLELGARVIDEDGKRLAPVATVLETDSRNPPAKHRILELYDEHRFRLPDTPVMALHRGRIDLLEEHLRRDPGLLRRRFSHEEIYPRELGCHRDEVMATHGTPLAGSTLLHMCADYGEIEIARWLLERGMCVDERAAVDAEGFGGHTALFGTVVSQANFGMNQRGEADAQFARLLLEHGADPNARASLRKELHPGYEVKGMYEYRDVTPLGWGERFHFRELANAAALELIRGWGGAG